MLPDWIKDRSHGEFTSKPPGHPAEPTKKMGVCNKNTVTNTEYARTHPAHLMLHPMSGVVLSIAVPTVRLSNNRHASSRSREPTLKPLYASSNITEPSGGSSSMKPGRDNRFGKPFFFHLVGSTRNNTNDPITSNQKMEG